MTARTRFATVVAVVGCIAVLGAAFAGLAVWIVAAIGAGALGIVAIGAVLSREGGATDAQSPAPPAEPGFAGAHRATCWKRCAIR